MELEDFWPSMRNLLERASVAQSLDGVRLTGSLRVPDARKTNDWARRDQEPAVRDSDAACSVRPLPACGGRVGEREAVCSALVVPPPALPGERGEGAQTASERPRTS